MHEALTRKKPKGFEACTGCSLCLLACPVWRSTHDIRYTPHGRAKAMQHGATAADLAASIDSCTLCGACEPACPEDLALVDMITGLRAALAVPAADGAAASPLAAGSTPAECLLPDAALAADAGVLAQAAALLGGIAVAADHGADIALALESGAAIAPSRLAAFFAPLGAARRLVVADGMLLRALRGWLPGVRIESLGEAASRTGAVRAALGRDDFYVIEPRAYHADRERLVGHYDGLRHATGCGINLDMQRLAISTTANSLPQRAGRNRVDIAEQVRWILEGHAFSRIVVEDLNDVAAFRTVTDKPVLHVAQVAA
jgi:ferredoxin